MHPRSSTLSLRPLAAATATLLVLAAGATAAVADDEALSAKLVVVGELRDGLSATQREEIRAAIAARRAKQGPASVEQEPRYPYFPQAGILGEDLFLHNFADLNPAAALVRDWDCSGYTYDGHRGHDSVIRTFREQAIGVPVFAVLPGVVVRTHDGEEDTSTELVPGAASNHVVVDHGGGYQGVYLHLRRGSVAVVPGEEVAAGRQLGLTGSSGFSTWPHLHFESWRDGEWFEPSAGPCRSGESFWLEQPLVEREFWIADLALWEGEAPGFDVETLAFDPRPRTGTFVRGRQSLAVRADLRNLPAGAAYGMRVLDPRGRLALSGEGRYETTDIARMAFALFTLELDLDRLGTWRLQLDMEGGQVADVPLRVVAKRAQVRNRPPSRVGLRLVPAVPRQGEVTRCEVQSSLLVEDPDFDVLGYRYEWRVDTRVVRHLISAARSDVLAADQASAGSRLSCRVTPVDGRAAGPPATVMARVE
jgi:murein DD-endopeptidase MepM/ murein hydrolase activator NlpD